MVSEPPGPGQRKYIHFKSWAPVKLYPFWVFHFLLVFFYTRAPLAANTGEPDKYTGIRLNGKEPSPLPGQCGVLTENPRPLPHCSFGPSPILRRGYVLTGCPCIRKRDVSGRRVHTETTPSGRKTKKKQQSYSHAPSGRPGCMHKTLRTHTNTRATVKKTKSKRANRVRCWCATTLGSGTLKRRWKDCTNFPTGNEGPHGRHASRFPKNTRASGPPPPLEGKTSRACMHASTAGEERATLPPRLFPVGRPGRAEPERQTTADLRTPSPRPLVSR